MERKKTNITIEDIVQFPARVARVMEGLEDEIEYLVENNFFEEFQQLTCNMDKILQKMEMLTDSLDKFTESVETITQNTAAVAELESRMSLRGIVTHTIKDVFFLIGQVVHIAVLNNIRRLNNLRKRNVASTSSNTGDSPKFPTETP